MPLVQDLLHARFATTNRLVLYGVLSTLAVSLVILNAFKSYSNFYSVAVYLSRSNRSVMVLANFAVLGALLVGRGIQHVLFGSLRANEVERLYDRIWFFLTESLLAFTIFRDEFDVSFGVMFGFLLFVKCFHWLMSFRIEWMDQIQYPGPNMWFHVRMNVLFLFLWCIDTIMLCFAIESILTHGIGGIVLFASEYAILMASALNSMSKYFIIFYDIRRAASRGGENAPVWEDKSMFIFYVELVTDFLKLITYLTFFLLVLTFYGLPLNIVRDVYLTARSFINRCRDLVRYRTATRNMDERYPNATEDELTQMNDRTCIICRDEMVFRNPTAQPAAEREPAAERAPAGVNDTPKKLPCGHVFHFHCLRSWLERQQSCPTCRRTVLETAPPAQNAGAPGQPRAPPAPQPGAIPQMQGFGNPPQPQQQQPGFLARLFGNIAGAPPAVPGQFVPGPAFFNQQQQQQQGGFNNQPPAQQGFPAQNPFGPWQQPGYYVPPQQAPPPVQVLQGFYIGNQWQPWGAPPQLQQGRPQPVRVQGRVPPAVQAQFPQMQPMQPVHPQMQPAHPQMQPPMQPAPPPQMQPPPRPTPTSTAPDLEDGGPRTASSETSTQSDPTGGPSRPTGSAATAPPSSSASSPTSPHANPREAAALAALRRLGSKAPSPSPSTTPQDSTSSMPRATQMGEGTRPVPPPSPPPPALRQPLNRTASTSAIPTPRPPSTAPASSRPARAPVPSLIPLFDPATTSATIVAPPPLHRAPHTAPSYQPYPNAHPQLISPQHPQHAQHQQHLQHLAQLQQQRRSRPADTAAPSEFTRGTAPLPDIRSLPPTLTQDQLSRLDTITRDAIDERLRALENVQGAMWRSVEELVRVRSLLPVRAGPPASPSQPHEPAPRRERTPERGEGDSGGKGKEKAVVSEEAPDAASGSEGVADRAVPAVVQVEPAHDAPAEIDKIPVVADPVQ